MEKVYLDNAATTPLDKEVADRMYQVMTENFGNPSSIHWYGRQSRTMIEQARRTVAKLLGVSPGEIFFTSGGTEADNMAICCSVNDLGVSRIITSPIEHHAVLHSAERMHDLGKAKLDYVKVKPDGHIDLEHLKELLSASSEKTLVSLMHANNEIGNVLPIEKVGELCAEHGAYFHSDTVQTIAHLPLDVKNAKLHFLAASAHKFHGPKGIGFIYVNGDVKLRPFISGGSQERNMRGGTENLYGIIGLAKAMEIAYENLDEHSAYIKELKNHMINRLKEEVPGVVFNGDVSEGNLFTVLNVSFPPSNVSDMLLFKLDIEGISVSGGSACTSGSNQGSHVLSSLPIEEGRSNLRFSFSKFNTIEEIDFAVEKLKGILQGQPV